MTTVYVDRGMAWCTVAGGFVANFLLGGLAKSYGLIMEAFQEVFQSGTAYLLFAGGLIYTLMYCLSIVNHYISQRYGSRPVVLVGAFGSCISLLIAAFSPGIALWVVAVGVGLGASLSCIYFTVFAVIGRCFRRYLGLANGISVAGVSVGQMAFPSLITYLNQTYGTRGGAVIMSAICLHLLITAVLMPRYIVDPDDPTTFPKKKTKKLPKDSKSRFWRKRRSAHANGSVELTTTPALTPSEAKKKAHDDDLAHFYTEVMDDEKLLHPMGDQPEQTVVLPVRSEVESKSDRELARALLAVYIVAKIFGDIGDVSVSFVAPAFGTELGFDAVTVSRAIAFSGAVDLVSRLGVGWLTDRPGCAGRRGILMASVWIVAGINSLGFAELKQFFHSSNGSEKMPTMLVVGYFFCFGVQGVCSGTAMTQMVVVLADYVGSARVPHSLAMTMVVLGLLISPGQFSIGYLADVTESYVWPLRLCFIILVLAGLLLFLEFPVRWCHARKYPQLSSKSHLNQKTCLTNGSTHPENQHWKVANSDSDSEPETPHSLVQPGIAPVPAHLALAGANSGDCHTNALFVCAQEQYDEDWSEA